jgi:hypothetical protein
MTTYARVEFMPFEIEHLSQMGIKVPAWQAADMERCRGWTMMVDGKPLLSGGICQMWPGVAEGWQFAMPEWRRYLKSVVREMRRRIPQLWEEPGLRRLQASCHNAPEYWAWLEYLGFQWEGLMANYGLEGEEFIRARYIDNRDRRAARVKK